MVKAEFIVSTDDIKFTTQKNGDRLDIHGKINLSQETASNLAWLVNSNDHLHIEIKEATNGE